MLTLHIRLSDTVVNYQPLTKEGSLQARHSDKEVMYATLYRPKFTNAKRGRHVHRQNTAEFEFVNSD